MLTRIKKRGGLLLTLAVLCTTVAVVPQTAGAAASKVPNTGVGADVFLAPTDTTFLRACPGSTAAAAGFTDTTSADVDCIKMFGITQGATATTYEPAGNIPRWQMALFIHRMFTPTSVAAAGLTAVPAFDDISGLSTEIQNAINALASHGITLGTSATKFSPDNNVTREQMALFLNRFAGIATTSAGAAIASSIATQEYNYSDIGSATFEGMEAIIRLFNLGVTEGTCTSGVRYVTAGTCSSTFRPQDNITRAEMATMVTALLNHTNARPAGVVTQATGSTALPGSTVTAISVRNADFTPKSNTLVDEFYQVHNDTAGVAAQPPFHAVLGTCTASNVGTGAGTKCTIDNADKMTDVRGNAVGATQSTAAYSTGNWWVWTGAGGELYVDGTTSSFYKLSHSYGASATAPVNADRTTYTSSKALAIGVDLGTGTAGVTATDGTSVIAGDSITFTATMDNSTLTTAGTAHTVVDGYTFKFADHSVDHLGNVSNTVTYVPSSGGTASYTVTCPADDTTLNLDYKKSHEITVSMAAADGGTGIPANASPANPINSQVGRMNNNTLNVSCMDDPRAYDPAGGDATNATLAIDTNTYTVATAGSLQSVTATAYDQYGVGIAGVTAQFQKDGSNAAVLTTGADGRATLTSVVCTANGVTAWSIETDTGVMKDIGAATPSHLVEGTTTYCVSAATDTPASPGSIATLYNNVTAVNTVYTISSAGTASQGSVTCTINGVAATAFVFNAASNVASSALNDASTSNAAAAVYAAGPPQVWTVTNAGGASLPTCASTLKTAGNADLAANVAATAAGTIGTTLEFIDNDAASNTFVAKRTVQDHGVTTTTYLLFTYDSDDNFETAGTGAGETEAQFEAAMAAVTNLTTDLTITQRTGAATTGVSHFQIA